MPSSLKLSFITALNPSPKPVTIITEEMPIRTPRTVKKRRTFFETTFIYAVSRQEKILICHTSKNRVVGEARSGNSRSRGLVFQLLDDIAFF